MIVQVTRSKMFLGVGIFGVFAYGIGKFLLFLLPMNRNAMPQSQKTKAVNKNESKEEWIYLSIYLYIYMGDLINQFHQN